MYELDKKKFGAFVAELRKENGYTQKELAEKLFISDKAVSKWETAVSIPDTSLLVPLAELLGVSVTELLMCERMETKKAMETDQVEDIVKTAISFHEEKTIRAYQIKSPWPMRYLLSVILGCLGAVVGYRNGNVDTNVFVAVPLGIIFGAYFCYFVKMRLPRYYDENKICVYYDYGVRMNMIGIRFNNSNWPYIVECARRWACSTLAVYPWFSFGMKLLIPESWRMISLFVFLGALMGGLMIPIYVVGKKYE